MQPLEADEPTTVGPYRLLGRLGHGGMGRVYLGRSAGGRTVAVKVVHPHFALDDEFRARFRREVDAARRVGGTWTAPVLDADPEARVPWVATGYVAGPSLAQAAGEGRALPAHSVRVLGAGLAEALTAVHGLGLVHRDVKPSNVLLTVDGPRLFDFGIARATDGTASLTSTGVSIGSPGYMAPEQILGKGVTGAADVFSLGAVLVYAATGRSPFLGDSSAALLYKVVHEEPELDALSGDLKEVAAACLSKEAAGRPTPEEVARVLAPEGAARLVAAGWLPGALVEQVSRSAVQLLDLDTAVPAGPAEPASGPVGFSSPSVTGGSQAAPRPGVFGPPDPSYAALPQPREDAEAGGQEQGKGTADAKPGRLSVSVSATSAPTSAGGRGRKVSCSVALAVAGAMAAVTVGGIVFLNTRTETGGGADAGAEPPPAATAAPSKAPTPKGVVPPFYVGTWEGKATATTALGDVQFDTYRVRIKQAAVGKRLGTVTSTDPLGVTCVDVLTLKSASATELIASGAASPDNGGTCAKGPHTVHLERVGKTVKYSSQYPQAGNPKADLSRVEQP
ncbi:serine/threonine-protein kinase [Streptomyces sp. NPDC059524]|uniref:serine/threonine-protein kinase n=1 Tax=Streptomyces sp. NPDC059524 TaxID=3346856 RepID=UPI0036D19BAD